MTTASGRHRPNLHYTDADDGIHLACAPCGWDTTLGFGVTPADAMAAWNAHLASADGWVHVGPEPEPEHQCMAPRQLGHVPHGSIWQCGTCGKQLRLVVDRGDRRLFLVFHAAAPPEEATAP